MLDDSLKLGQLAKVPVPSQRTRDHKAIVRWAAVSYNSHKCRDAASIGFAPVGKPIHLPWTTHCIRQRQALPIYPIGCGTNCRPNMEENMSFIVGVCVPFLALLSGVVLDDISVSTPQRARRIVPLLDAWWAQQDAPTESLGPFVRETGENKLRFCGAKTPQKLG